VFKRIFSGFSDNLTHGLALRLAARLLPLSLVFLLIEFFDELHYTVDGAALPAIRDELGLSYTQVGLLLGLPHLVSVFIEPVIFLLGDTGLRKRLVLWGGLAVSAALLLVGSAGSFSLLLLAALINYPASGAFVSLSQATLMDLKPGREAQSMARWTAAGSLGNLLGPLLLVGVLALGLGWRAAFLVLALLALGLVLLTSLQRFPRGAATTRAADEPEAPNASWRTVAGDLLRNLWAALRNPRLLRWLFLLEFSDLLLDVLTDYLPLYLTDVTGLSTAFAGILLSVSLLASFAADLLLIPLLERFPGRKVVRLSAGLALVVYPAFLLAPWLPVKIALLLALRFTTIGWYSVLQGEAYAAVPGRSGTVSAAGSLGSLLVGGLTWLIGWVANEAGLQASLWLLLLGPLALVLGVPRPEGKGQGELTS
jgi:FSR family fosmidomycin resistance protein-like MFS transporter